MTTRTETRTCKTCGATFTARVGTGVVNCQACRKARREGTTAKVVRVSTQREITAAGHTCTVVIGNPMIRCGKKAVYAFKTDRGEIFAECAEHVQR